MVKMINLETASKPMVRDYLDSVLHYGLSTDNKQQIEWALSEIENVTRFLRRKLLPKRN